MLEQIPVNREIYIFGEFRSLITIFDGSSRN
jgi:hypothetical protein